MIKKRFEFLTISTVRVEKRPCVPPAQEDSIDKIEIKRVGKDAGENGRSIMSFSVLPIYQLQ